MPSTRMLVAITGASGAPYALAFLHLLHQKGVSTDLILSQAALEVFPLETGLGLEDLKPMVQNIFAEEDLSAPAASGSADYQAMVIIPCTMGTLSAIAQGAARNLIQRAADVMLKERRRLVLVVRETPLNLIHLRNMVLASEAGAVIYPAMPAFYHKPQSISEMINFFVQKLAFFLGLEVPEMKRWGEE